MKAFFLDANCQTCSEGKQVFVDNKKTMASLFGGFIFHIFLHLQQLSRNSKQFIST